MTESEKEQIRVHRLKGAGYKAIATMLGMTRDRVRGYCRRNGLGGDAQVVALNVQEKIKERLLCACCKKSINQKKKGRARKFCSKGCRRKWWRENSRARKRNETAVYYYICHRCGKGFSCYGNSKRKYCSHGCYIKSRFGSEENGI